MNENDLEKKENDKEKFLSLKKENEDNLIENTSKTNKILEKIEEKEINEPAKYKIDYRGLIAYIKKPRQKNIDDQNELIANLLLMPSNIPIKDKASTLCCLSDLYSKRKQNELIRFLRHYFLTIVWSRSGPIEIILMGVSNSVSRNFTYALKAAGNSSSLVIFVMSVFQPGSSL